MQLDYTQSPTSLRTFKFSGVAQLAYLACVLLLLRRYDPLRNETTGTFCGVFALASVRPRGQLRGLGSDGDPLPFSMLWANIGRFHAMFLRDGKQSAQGMRNS